jgi:hypothetical protein
LKNVGLIFEDKSPWDGSLKVLLWGVPALTLMVGLALLYVDQAGAVVMFAVTFFDALLFRSIMPRSIQIYPDRLRIVLGRPFSINISLSNIKEARRASGSKASVYFGIRLVTSSRYILEIVPRKGLPMVVSPASGDLFLEQLKQAMSEAARSTGQS